MAELQADLDVNYPSSEFSILAINEFGEDSANDLAASLTDLPLLQDVDANSDGMSDVWQDWGAVWRDVRILDSSNEFKDVYNLTTHDLANADNYATLRQMMVSVATDGKVAASTWQNAAEPYDVNADGFVVPADVLNIIDYINTNGSGDLVGNATNRFLDVNGDGSVSGTDAVRVVRHLNLHSLVGAQGEPEDAPPAVSQAAATDVVFALATLSDKDKR